MFEKVLWFVAVAAVVVFVVHTIKNSKKDSGGKGGGLGKPTDSEQK